MSTLLFFNNLKHQFDLPFSHMSTCYILIVANFLFLYETLQTTNENMKFIIYFHVIFHVKMFYVYFNHVGYVIFHIKMFMTIFKQLTKSMYMLNTPHIFYYVV